MALQRPPIGLFRPQLLIRLFRPLLSLLADVEVSLMEGVWVGKTHLDFYLRRYEGIGSVFFADVRYLGDAQATFTEDIVRSSIEADGGQRLRPAI